MIRSDIFVEYPYELLSFMREQKMPAFHNSNIFMRDLQYAIKHYFEDKEGTTIRNDLAEELAGEVARAYIQKGIFKKVNPIGFELNYPELSTPKDGGTIAGFAGMSPDELMPPKAAAPAIVKPAAVPKPAAAPKPVAPTPAAAASAPASGAVPAGAKGATPPWLKK